jgi:Nif-specific regulatory protein
MRVIPGEYAYRIRKLVFMTELSDMVRTEQRMITYKKERDRALSRLNAEHGFHNITGNSAAVENMIATIRTVSETGASVLLTGETGTGKDLAASAIHAESSRKGPFIKVDCAALPLSLIESELFGHEKGAFTGATSRRIGRFEQAHGGTIFLDEIGNLSPPVQMKLLRFLQDRTFERLGGKKTLKSDVRIIAATNVNLEKEVGKGDFRSDLYCPGQ